MSIEEFKIEIEKLGILYTDDSLKKLELYCDYLLLYNMHTNLTAIKDKKSVYLKHFFDSLTLVKVVDLESITNVIDIGSGAGFPGVVLKIFYPHLHVTLIDSNNKKTKFLQSLVEKLELINMDIVNDRVENFSKNNLNMFDLVTARAVTNMRVLTELSMPLVKKNGLFVAMKGNSEEELSEALDTIEIMGGSLVTKEEFDLNGVGSRSLIVIKKQLETDSKEIRDYDKIVKKPLQKKGK